MFGFFFSLMKKKLILIKLITEENGETCLYCPNKYKLAKNHSLKAYLGKERKNGMQEAAQNVNRLYLTWEKHTDDRLLMN